MAALSEGHTVSIPLRDTFADMLLYFRPSAWADLYTSRSSFDSGRQATAIQAARLEMVCEYQRPRCDSRVAQSRVAGQHAEG
jgi:hypothetical protein